MSISNRLSLDHFYIGLSKPQIEKIRSTLDLLGAKFENVQSGESNWSGFYITSRIGDYFEILEDTRLGGFGLALSSTNQNYFDTKSIIKSMSEFNWNSGTRILENNENWFDWYATTDYLNDAEIFNVWIMDYYKRHLNIKDMPTPKVVFAFEEIELNLGVDNFDRILNVLKLPLFHHFQYQKDHIEFKVLKKDGWFFKIKINLLDGNFGFVPKKLKLSCIKDGSFSNIWIDFT